MCVSDTGLRQHTGVFDRPGLVPADTADADCAAAGDTSLLVHLRRKSRLWPQAHK
jgi:hypothetical protein